MQVCIYHKSLGMVVKAKDIEIPREEIIREALRGVPKRRGPLTPYRQDADRLGIGFSPLHAESSESSERSEYHAECPSSSCSSGSLVETFSSLTSVTTPYSSSSSEWEPEERDREIMRSILNIFDELGLDPRPNPKTKLSADEKLLEDVKELIWMPECIHHLYEIFVLFGAAGAKGTVPSSRLGDMLRSCGQFYTADDIRELRRGSNYYSKFYTTSSFPEFGDMTPICFLDFLKIVTRKFAQTPNWDLVYRSFLAMDRNGKGFIYTRDLMRVVSSTGEKVHRGTVAALMRINDVEGDVLSYEEFARM